MTIKPLVLESPRLRISFQPAAGDRIGHTIEALAGGSAALLLASVEGTAAEPWPASPPFQQAHLESRPGGRQVVLLVGMAGSSHWSASVEIDPASDAALFDVACRMHGRADWLGSRYRVSGRQAACESEKLRVAHGVTAAPGESELSLGLELVTGGDGARLALAAGEARVDLGAVESATARTVRWLYRVWAPSGR